MGCSVGIVWAVVQHASDKRRLPEGGSEELDALRGEVEALADKVSSVQEAVAHVTLMLADSQGAAALTDDESG
jgi:hypothetical protein